MLKKIDRKFFIDRIGEASTWRGLIAVITACGIQISPETALQIITIGTGLAGVVGMLFPDKK